MIYCNDDFIYDSETGGLIWAREHKSGGCGYSGKYAPCPVKPDAHGYLKVGLNRKEYKQHRLAWFMVYGRWPHEIDHINGIRTDNRLKNLREVNRSENQRNKKLRSDNKTGCHGIYWNKQAKKWVAHINISVNKEKYIGIFETKKEAIKARKEAEKKFKYHKNHGRC